MLKGRAAVWGTKAGLEELDDGTILKFSKAKCQVLHLGWNNLM